MYRKNTELKIMTRSIVIEWTIKTLAKWLNNAQLSILDTNFYALPLCGALLRALG